MELVQAATTIALLVFVITSMLAMGLSLSPRQIAEPLRDTRLVLLSLAANFIVMPLGAILLARLLQLKQPLAVGFLLLGCAAGAPFLPKLAEIAKADLAFAVGLMVLLMVVTVVFMPLVLPLALPGVSIDPAKIARTLILLMLLPLSIALAFRARYASVAERFKPAIARVSSLGLIAFVILVALSNVRNMVELFGTRGLFAAASFIALGIVTGLLLGGTDARVRRTLALGTAQRNIAAAVVVGGQIGDPRAVVMIVVVALIGFAILMPLSRAFGRPGSAEPVASSGDA